ncbi:MAG: MOSC domain-containing protein [Alphaproteobacteria bacterium]
MSDGTIKSLHRYPVKSMGGEDRHTVHIGPNGVPGDRAWAVRDEERGGIRGAKRFAELMQCKAHYEVEPADQGSSTAVITLPSGEQITTGDETAASELSNLVESPVTLWPLMPKEALDHYRRGAPVLDDMEAELRRMFGRADDEPLPDLSVFPPELVEFESPLGTYFDAFPLLLVTKQSLTSLAQLAPDRIFDIRRFRPNIVLDAPSDAPFPEQAWEGKKLRIGQAVLKLEIMCPRCVMVTHGFDELPKDPGIMRTLVQKTGGNLGIYASVVETGEIKTGDEITLID